MTTGVPYVNHILRIDVKTGEIKREQLDAAELRKFIGGNGVALKILYDEVPPEVKPLDPENKLIFTAGPFNGTKIPGSGIFQVSARGPLSNYLVSAQANGYLGARMRHAGHETIIFENAADDWIYIWIHDDKVEIRSAAHLTGLDTWETQKTLKEEINKPNLSIACIGPAGENLVPYACISSDEGHIASTNGPGCVQGSKKIKAIVISSTHKTVDTWADESKEIRANFIAAAEASGLGAGTKKSGTLGNLDGLVAFGGCSTKNFTTNEFDYSALIEREEWLDRKKTTCWACPWAHTGINTVKQGKAKGYVAEEPEYESVVAFTSNIGNPDLGEAVRLAYICEAMGVDLKELTFTLSLAMECFEKGLITLEDTGGLDLTWGNTDAVAQLIEDIAHRRGFGAQLAGGVKKLSQSIGGEARNMGIYTGRGLAPNVIDIRMDLGNFYHLALSETGSFYGGAGLDPDVGNNEPFDPINDYYKVGWNMSGNSTKWLLMDSYGCCMFWAHGAISTTVDTINACTGWDMTPEELLKCGERIKTLSRAYNIRCGLTKEIEMAVSPRYQKPYADGPGKGRIDKYVDERAFNGYYERNGWDLETGKPLPETLKNLRLEYIINDIWE